VGISGRLTGFDLWLQRPQEVTQPLLFDSRTTEAGVPTELDAASNILGNGSIAADSVPLTSNPNGIPSVTHVDIDSFSSNVKAGDTLAIRLSTTTNLGATNGFFWRGNEAGGYTDGAAFVRSFGRIGNSGGWKTQNVVDQLFRTYVLPVPEPSSLLSLAVCAIAYAARRRRPTSNNRS